MTQMTVDTYDKADNVVDDDIEMTTRKTKQRITQMMIQMNQMAASETMTQLTKQIEIEMTKRPTTYTIQMTTQMKETTN